MIRYASSVCVIGLLSALCVIGVSEAKDLRMRDIAYHDEGRMDPFIPLIGKNVELKKVDYVKSVNDLHIEGILVDAEKGSVVIVNGHILKVDNYIGGFRIDEIRKHEVVFSRDEQKFTLTYGTATESSKENDSAMFRNFDDTV